MRPRRDVERLQSEIQELLEDLWQVPRFSGLREGFRPAVDCFRSLDPPELTVVVELAGVDPDTIDVVVADRSLVVSGERQRPGAGRRVSYQQMEIEHGPFQCRIPIGEDVDTASARASYEHGLLTVVLPIAPPSAPARTSIAVKRRP